MKKFLSVLMVLILALSIGATTFAANNNGKITITNATIGESYKIYKLFDAIPTDDGKGVSYVIDPVEDAALFKALFGADGKATNEYLTYIAASNAVRKIDGTNDSELVGYLTEIVLGTDTTQAVEVNFTQEQTNVATTEVVFDNLPYGYYLITSSLGAVVTLDSNTPTVEIIDKNQNPGAIDKKVVTGAKADVMANPDAYVFADSNTANIGDLVTYKISFTATNYDGDQIVKYYQINDVKGDAIWAEFDSFTVKVGEEELKKGYYLPIGNVNNTGEWKWLGDWSDIPEDERDRNDADWYLVHLGYDQFRITIPWLKNHDIEGNETGTNPGPYTLTFPTAAEHRFSAHEEVTVMYEAAIEPGAVIGQPSDTNLYNTATLSWITSHDVFSGGEDRVVTYTYGIGLIKEDSATRDNLQGAIFEIYADEALQVPVYVIPTKVAGVYIVDSLNCPSAAITGLAMEDARELYGKEIDGGLQRLTTYLDGDLTKQKNQVVSQINGRLIIIGLEEGDYYLVETQAPAGYNALSKPQQVNVDRNSSVFTIFKDAQGNVADIQQATDVYSEVSYQLSTVTVQNSIGRELPSTGGEGTFWMITIGSLIAIAFAVFLITHKKMSVYTD